MRVGNRVLESSERLAAAVIGECRTCCRTEESKGIIEYGVCFRGENRAVMFWCVLISAYVVEAPSATNGYKDGSSTWDLRSAHFQLSKITVGILFPASCTAWDYRWQNVVVGLIQPIFTGRVMKCTAPAAVVLGLLCHVKEMSALLTHSDEFDITPVSSCSRRVVFVPCIQNRSC